MLKCLVLIIALVLLVWLCLIPSRYSDGRIPENVAREMYHTQWDTPVHNGDEQ
jgi:hypothetical protein